MTMLVYCVVTVVFAVGGTLAAMMFLVKSGKLGGAGHAGGAVVEKKDAEPVTHPKALEPMLINLADDGGHAYLRLGVVLAEEDEPGAKAKEEAKPVAGADASVRDTIFDVLGRQTSTELLAADGKEKLKAALMKAIAQRNAELHVKQIYFTDFLVQR
jgi:flagellar FliL protein